MSSRLASSTVHTLPYGFSTKRTGNQSDVKPNLYLYSLSAVPYPGNSPGFLFSLEKREEEEIPCISFVIWIFAVDYIDTGVHYIFVKLARDRRRSSYRQMGLQGREREARWEVVLRSYIQTECSPNYRRLLLNSLVGRLSVVLNFFLCLSPRVSRRSCVVIRSCIAL